MVSILKNTMSEKIALIDFCGTIADFQTLDPFLQYVCTKEHPLRSFWINSSLTAMLCALITRVLRVFGSKRYVYKCLLVHQLKGLNKTRLSVYGEEYYINRIKDHFIIPTIEIIDDLRSCGYRLVIVSGGSDLYIRKFADEYGIDDVISAQFGYKEDICNGKLTSECMGSEKVDIIADYFKEHGIIGEILTGISDSCSDLPMLNLCKHKIVVSHGKHQEWVHDDIEEVIWR